MTYPLSSRERVSVSRCAPETDDAEIVRATVETIDRLGDLGPKIRDARTIAVKINAGVDRVILTGARQTELSEPAVVEGVIRALRSRTDATLLVGDAATDSNSPRIYANLGLPERLAPYPGVRLVDFNESELLETEMLHDGAMFRRYSMPREVVEADAIVSVSKMKAHTSVGFTLCLKNLFGWMPTRVYGAPRMYLHDRLIRLPRVLADLGRWLQPSLNVVDGIIAANKSEWGGEALQPGVLLAGTNVIATDSVGARLMGFDPLDDYPVHPFLYRRNPVRLAGLAGLGPLRAEEIEILGEDPTELVTPFSVQAYGDRPREEQIAQRNAEIRAGAACVSSYQEQRPELLDRYGKGRFVSFRDGEPLFDGPTINNVLRQEKESGRNWRNSSQFAIRLLPRDEEIEDFRWYAREAEEIP